MQSVGYVYYTRLCHPVSSELFHYVGQKKRSSVAEEYYGSGVRITRMLKKHGPDAILDRTIVYWADSQEELDFAEIMLICWVKEGAGRSCLNLKYGGDHGSSDPRVGRKISRTKQKSPTPPPYEHMIAMGVLARTPEARAKISQSLSDRVWKKSTRRKVRDANLGKRLSAETRRRMSIAKQNMSDETRAKMGASRLGIKLTKATRLKMSMSKKGISQSPEHIAKRIARGLETRRLKALTS